MSAHNEINIRLLKFNQNVQSCPEVTRIITALRLNNPPNSQSQNPCQENFQINNKIVKVMRKQSLKQVCEHD